MHSRWMLLGTLIGCFAVQADEKTPPYQPERFLRTQILPILEKHCFECHSHEHEVEGGLALDSQSGRQAGGEAGAAVVPFDLKNSPLIQAVRHLDKETAMPPKKKLRPIEIALLETWVLLGAPDPRK